MKLRVVHLVDEAGVSDRIWGKENVIASLMEAQEQSGLIAPELVTFTPGALSHKLERSGFRVHSLEQVHRRLPTRALGRLRTLLTNGSHSVLHTHEYKANILGRLSRATGAPIRKLVATCHGWVDRSPQLDAYFAIDRWSAILSNVVTVTDPQMLSKFSKIRPLQTVFVQNAIADRSVPDSNERLAARTRLGFPLDATVIGSLGRLTKNKGIHDILAAASRTQNLPIIWAIAGAGALADEVAKCALPNVRFVGYQSDSATYLAALDVYLQASHFEGLSLSLLEAMRAALPSISTKAGATEIAVRDGREGLLIDAGNIDAVIERAHRLHADRSLRAELGTNARAHFVNDFTIERQHKAFLELYES